MSRGKLNCMNIEYRKRLIIGNIICILLIICGGVSIGLSIYSRLNGNIILNDFANGFYTGTGGGLIGSGIMTIILNTIKLKNEEKLKKAEIESNDERNKFIVQKSFSASALIGFFSLYIGVIISGFYNEIVFTTLLCCLGGFALIIFIVYVILNKLI